VFSREKIILSTTGEEEKQQEEGETNLLALSMRRANFGRQNHKLIEAIYFNWPQGEGLIRDRHYLKIITGLNGGKR